MFGLSSLFLVWLTRSGARKLPRESAAQLSKGWMLTYQTGALIAALLLFADAVAVLSPAGPALYLVGLGWHLFMAASLFVRLLMAPAAPGE